MPQSAGRANGIVEYANIRLVNIKVHEVFEHVCAEDRINEFRDVATSSSEKARRVSVRPTRETKACAIGDGG